MILKPTSIEEYLQDASYYALEKSYSHLPRQTV